MKPHPQLLGDQKTISVPYKTTGMKSLAIKSIKVGNKIDPCGKLFSHAGSFLVMQAVIMNCICVA